MFDLNGLKYKKLARNYYINGYSRIYQIHIRKTGGTSLTHMIWAAEKEDTREITRKINRKWDRRIKVNDKVFAGWNLRVINRGHYYYAFSHAPLHKLDLPDNTFTFTCLRDPVKRVISHYKMLKNFEINNINHPCMKVEGHWLGNSPVDFLERIPKEHLLNQLYMFSKNFDIEEAFDNICNCSHVLLTRKLPEHSRNLGRKLNLELKPRHVRKGSFDIQFDDKFIDRLTDMLEKEYRLIEKLQKADII